MGFSFVGVKPFSTGFQTPTPFNPPASAFVIFTNASLGAPVGQ
ncbi:MAG: hypothetical protein KatS3mg129_3018 [Leptospiraceae bacterium]|nr:MAG: hypothetical protein KatS3mg129_3018 [Leptospiraceae bacterium]